MSLKCAQNHPVATPLRPGERVFVSDAVLIEVGTLHLPISLVLNPWLDPWVSRSCQLRGREMEEDGWE